MTPELNDVRILVLCLRAAASALIAANPYSCLPVCNEFLRSTDRIVNLFGEVIAGEC